jgi:hypothetical protein
VILCTTRSGFAFQVSHNSLGLQIQLCRQYESVFTKEDTSTTIPKPAGNPFPSMPDINISEEGVLKLLLKINPIMTDTPLIIAGQTYNSRLLVGSGKYQDLTETKLATEAAAAEIITNNSRAN